MRLSARYAWGACISLVGRRWMKTAELGERRWMRIRFAFRSRILDLAGKVNRLFRLWTLNCYLWAKIKSWQLLLKERKWFRWRRQDSISIINLATLTYFWWRSNWLWLNRTPKPIKKRLVSRAQVKTQNKHKLLTWARTVRREERPPSLQRWYSRVTTRIKMGILTEMSSRRSWTTFSARVINTKWRCRSTKWTSGSILSTSTKTIRSISLKWRSSSGTRTVTLLLTC